VTRAWFGIPEDEWEPLRPDPDAAYVARIRLDLSKVVPMIAKPYRPDNVEAAARLSRERIKVDQVYVGSCTNGSFDDVRAFAESLEARGGRVHPEVRVIVVPSSQSAYAELIEHGIMAFLQRAGCQIMPPGCGACIGTHWGVLGDGEVGFFTSNRNFRGRTGSREAKTYLGSPVVAGIVAATGVIDVDAPDGTPQEAVLREAGETAGATAGGVEPVEVLPEEEGVPAIAVKRDHINTDEIIPARYCNTVVPEELAPHALEDYDPTLAGRIAPGSVLVGLENFGCGSSREVAAVTLKAAGVGAVIAKSFGAIFERNCINNALPVFRSRVAPDRIQEGDRLVVRPERGEVINLTRRERYTFPPLTGAAADVIAAGSLARYIRQQLGRKL
jgi:homoaconitate hydratase